LPFSLQFDEQEPWRPDQNEIREPFPVRLDGRAPAVLRHRRSEVGDAPSEETRGFDHGLL